jgi:hypothetical protein
LLSQEVDPQFGHEAPSCSLYPPLLGGGAVCFPAAIASHARQAAAVGADDNHDHVARDEADESLVLLGWRIELDGTDAVIVDKEVLSCVLAMMQHTRSAKA